MQNTMFSEIGAEQKKTEEINRKQTAAVIDSYGFNRLQSFIEHNGPNRNEQLNISGVDEKSDFPIEFEASSFVCNKRRDFPMKSGVLFSDL